MKHKLFRTNKLSEDALLEIVSTLPINVQRALCEKVGLEVMDKDLGFVPARELVFNGGIESVVFSVITKPVN